MLSWAIADRSRQCSKVMSRIARFFAVDVSLGIQTDMGCRRPVPTVALYRNLSRAYGRIRNCDTAHGHILDTSVLHRFHFVAERPAWPSRWHHLAYR